MHTVVVVRGAHPQALKQRTAEVPLQVLMPPMALGEREVRLQAHKLRMEGGRGVRALVRMLRMAAVLVLVLVPGGLRVRGRWLRMEGGGLRDLIMRMEGIDDLS